MNQSMGMADFFAMEASEYLERLDVMVSASAPPDSEEFVRLTRAMRGSALMAGQQKVAGVAEGLEAVARGVADHRMEWSEAVRQLAIRAVDDLKILVRSARSWTDADDVRANKITVELQRTGGGLTQARRAVPTALDAGTRAFVAREGAAVGSALDRAARELERTPTAFAALTAVTRAMQPIRGIASLADLPPMPDLLEGIGRAIQEVNRTKQPNPIVPALFDAAARAVSRAAREISTVGHASDDAAESQEFVAHLGDLLSGDGGSVPVETLFYDDQGPHMVEQGTPPAGEPIPQVELVAHAEYLKAAAAALEQSSSSIQRALRIQTLHLPLRALAAAGGGSLANAAARFARAANAAINRGTALERHELFARQLRQASSILSEGAQGETDDADAQLRHVATELEAIGMGAVPQAPAAPEEIDIPEPDLEALVHEAATTHRLDAGDTSLAGEPADLATAYATCERLVAQYGATGGSIDELIAGRSFSVTGPAPATALAEPVLTPPPVLTKEPAEPAVVPRIPLITEFCYSGAAALDRAISLRDHVRTALATGTPDPYLTELIEEVFELVQLGIPKQA